MNQETTGPTESASQAQVATRKRLSQQLSEQHDSLVSHILSELKAEHPGGGAAAKLLRDLGAREAALHRELELLIAQLVGRAALLADRPNHVLALATALKAVSSTQVVIGQRVESFLAAADARSAAETQPENNHLRRVS